MAGEKEWAWVSSVWLASKNPSFFLNGASLGRCVYADILSIHKFPSSSFSHKWSSWGRISRLRLHYITSLDDHFTRCPVMIFIFIDLMLMFIGHCETMHLINLPFFPSTPVKLLMNSPSTGNTAILSSHQDHLMLGTLCSVVCKREQIPASPKTVKVQDLCNSFVNCP